MKVGKISNKDYILTVEEKQLSLIENNTKIKPEMNPWQRELYEIWLKASNIQIKKKIDKRKKLLSYIGGKICARFLQKKHQKVIKKNKDRTIKNHG